MGIDTERYGKMELPSSVVDPTAIMMKATAIVKKFEGFRAYPYKDYTGKWTQGYGSTGQGVHQNSSPVTEEAAESMLRTYMTKDLSRLVTWALKHKSTREFSAYQYAALLSWIYNFNWDRFLSSTLQKRLVAGAPLAEIQHQWMRWVHAMSQTTGEMVELPGLVYRRREEFLLFAADLTEGVNSTGAQMAEIKEAIESRMQDEAPSNSAQPSLQERIARLSQRHGSHATADMERALERVRQQEAAHQQDAPTKREEPADIPEFIKSALKPPTVSQPAMESTIDDTAYADFVEKLSPADWTSIHKRLNSSGNIAMLHGLIGMVSELGELADAFKKHIIYGKGFNSVNAAEESGDIDWYHQRWRNGFAARFGFPREGGVYRRQNKMKLDQRYPTGGFSEKDALARADKDHSGE